MSHALSDGAATVVLPQNMDWVDEFNWQPVQQATQYSLAGSLLVDEGTMLAGRPITLSPGAENMAAMQKSDLDTITGWAAGAGQVLALTLDDGRVFSVRFHHAATAIDARPIRGFRVPDGTEHDLWKVAIRFIEV